MTHPFRDAAIVGVFNTTQARALPGHDSVSIAIEGALGALADAGLETTDVDAIIGERSGELAYELRLGPCRRSMNGLGIPAVLEAASLIATGQSQVVLVVGGSAGVYTERASTAPWTRPTNEFVVGYGMFTAVEFALMAKRHMLTFGTTPEQLATVAATIRNNGHANPEAVYFGRGPYKPEDILASRLISEPFHLLDCSTTSEGGCGLVLTTADRAADLPQVAGVDPRRRQRRLRAGLPARADMGLRGTGRRWHPRRLRRPARRPRRVLDRRPPPGRRRRLRVLRSVLVRDHPPVRGLRVLSRRRGRPVRHGRLHRARREIPGDHRWGHHVVRPSR